ncbi:Bug family tripartite tricarboxylate transporter substrate binding protein [Mesorhizobium sp. ASY16-5R]|uniref:Bug family tripartite tricarboxylate transporter substrate binding protein n=1 Tax=Mesorhizobium sp. ASY16-5R TaxID=3445772 RepID=UPI003FA12ABB
MRKLIAGIALAAAFWAGSLAAASAQAATDWPTQPIKFVVSASAGGTSDGIARYLAQKLSQKLGQPVVVENVPGAGSVAGTNTAAQSQPDGYTMVITTNAAVAIAPLLRDDMPYTMDDLAAVTQTNQQVNLLVINPDKFAARDLAGVLKEIKDNPGKFSYGSSGVGATNHLAMELLKSAAGLDITHVPFKSSGDTMNALLGGHIDIALDGAPSVLPHVKSGALIPLAVSTPKRWDGMPELPALDETLPGVELVIWHGIYVKGGTPKPIIDKLGNALREIIHTPETVAFLKERGVQAVGSTPEELEDLVRREAEKWKKVIADAKISIE